FSLGKRPASEFFVALTITMTRIVVLLAAELLEAGCVLPEGRATAFQMGDERGRAGSTSGVKLFFIALRHLQIGAEPREGEHGHASGGEVPLAEVDLIE